MIEPVIQSMRKRKKNKGLGAECHNGKPRRKSVVCRKGLSSYLFCPLPSLRGRGSLHDNAAVRVLRFRLLEEHLALRGQVVAFLHEIVDSLAPVQDAFYRLMEHDLGLVKLCLDLREVVVLRMLRLLQVALQSRKRQFWVRFTLILELGDWMQLQELCRDDAQGVLRDQRVIFVVCQDGSADSLGSAI